MEDCEDKKRKMWEKASIVVGYDPAKYRKDACGAWIKWDKFNRHDSVFGWEIDHIYPKVVLKSKGVPDALIDSTENLRPLNWLNNSSKGKDYPAYISAITAKDKKNIRQVDYFEIEKDIQSKLEELYSYYL